MNGDGATEKATVGRVFSSQADADHKLVPFIKTAANTDFQFVCYPIGGYERVHHDITSSNSVPPIGVFDFQMAASVWQKWVCAVASPWIDLDAANDEVAVRCQEALRAELEYAQYLGVTAILLRPPTIHNSAKLAAFLCDFLWNRSFGPRIWIEVGTDDVDEVDRQDIWLAWRQFRVKIANHKQLAVCLRLTDDLADEFCDADLVERWVGEPVAACILPTSIFMNNDQTGTVYIPAMHERLVGVTQAVKPEAQLMIAGDEQADGWQLTPMRELCNQLVSRHKRKRREQMCLDYETEQLFSGYEDLLQIPLQPLSDNLDSATYEIFERDPFKYDQYGKAVEAALIDIVVRRKEGDLSSTPVIVNVMVLGAGRGPLVSQVNIAYEHAKIKCGHKNCAFSICLTAVEKNPNSFVTLKAKNALHWANKVTLINSDMRDYRPADVDKADLIVSELLGSFGDNELSPECLDGAAHLLKPDAISIPQRYTSTIEPISSVKMMNSIYDQCPNAWHVTSMGRQVHRPHRHHTLQQQQSSSHDNGQLNGASSQCDQGESTSSDWPDSHKWDSPYVVQLSSCHFWPGHPTQDIFTFEHPNTSNASNERSTTVTFAAPYTCEVSALAGYFECDLYDGRFLMSIEPRSYSKGMFSWFPAVFPLRSPLLLSTGDRLTVEMKRCCDGSGVWYEWRLTAPEVTTWQNHQGGSYYMRLQST